MRRALVLCLLLAGCAAPPPPATVHAAVTPPPSEAARRAALDPDFTASASAATSREVLRETREQADRDQRAATICNARAEMAGATYGGRGFGLAGAMTAGFEAGIAASRVRAACLDAYQRTGVMPSL